VNNTLVSLSGARVCTRHTNWTPSIHEVLLWVQKVSTHSSQALFITKVGEHSCYATSTQSRECAFRSMWLCKWTSKASLNRAVRMFDCAIHLSSFTCASGWSDLRTQYCFVVGPDWKLASNKSKHSWCER
jgi:hypothetical protein